MKRNDSMNNPHFITDSTGKKTAVILDIDTYDKLIDRLEDFYLASQAEIALEECDEFIDFDQIKKEFQQK